MTVYPGTELELFATAVRWKHYWASRVKPYVTGDVLEVGAGIGGSFRMLQNERVRRWQALEPDPALARQIPNESTTHPFTVSVGKIGDIDEVFDTILYVDVLEHIEEDATELELAASRLSTKGKLVVLSPAHQFLFSEFDATIGHHRRYSREELLTKAPPALSAISCEFIDSVGMLASVANRYLLRSGEPGPAQIAFWDRVLIPCSRVLDPVLGRRIGKTIICVWEKL